MQSKQLSDYSPAKITSEKLFVKKKIILFIYK